MSDVRPFEKALRQSLGSCTLAEDGYEFVDATMDGRTVLVLFRHGKQPASTRSNSMRHRL